APRLVALPGNGVSVCDEGTCIFVSESGRSFHPPFSDWSLPQGRIFNTLRRLHKRFGSLAIQSGRLLTLLVTQNGSFTERLHDFAIWTPAPPVPAANLMPRSFSRRSFWRIVGRAIVPTADL